MPGSILLHIYFIMYRLRFKIIHIPFLPSVYLSRNFYNLPVQLIRAIIVFTCDNSHLNEAMKHTIGVSCIRRDIDKL